ncbi:hypothetical protein L6Q96_10165 [Candidatus Binatia bacterium]|nr:hypothetical protein [Candidatus Binatia bacterium]
MLSTTMLRALLLGLTLTAAACGGGDSECDECSSDKDCDSGQYCASTTLGDRCLKNNKSSCEVGLGQL